MSYKIPSSKPIGRAIKSIASDEVKKAREALAPDARANWQQAAEAVHEARRRFKRVRALLRLAREGLGRKRYRKENVFYRDVGREIRDVRDGAALVEALDWLTLKDFKKPPQIVTRLKRLLVEEASRMVRGETVARGLARASRALIEERDRVDRWNLNDFGWKEARAAKAVARRACRKAYQTAMRAPTGENLHEWRKRVKDLWYEMLLLRTLFPKLEGELKALETLANLLGLDRDLSLLADAVENRRRKLGPAQAVNELMIAIGRRRKAAQKKAFGMGEKLWGPAK